MRVHRTLAVLSLTVAAAGQGDSDPWIAANLDSLVAFYEELHRNPEMSLREKETSRRIAAALREAGLDVTEKVGGYGVVAVLKNGPGPTVMVRGDMDALPVAEKTGLPYRSKIYTEDESGRAAGIMHACGHDIHMTNLVGTARYMAAHKGRWSGTLLCIGQPAEEIGAGAMAMLRAGLYERFPRPDQAIALHVSHELPTGTVGWVAGPAMANVDSVDITMFGKGGHGSAPHLCIDPVVQAAQLVLQLQTITSREIDAREPAVITVGSIHGGSTHNIIADRCDLQLTVRSYTDAVRARLKAAISRKAKAVAMAAGAPAPKVEYQEGTPALVNTPALVARAVGALRRGLGEAAVVEITKQMVGEDFSRFGRAGVPVFLFRLGTIAPERLAKMRAAGEQPPSLHSPYYFPDPAGSLSTGIRATTAILFDLLPRR